MKKKNSKTLDLIGISSATICLFHCLIFPFLTIMPVYVYNNHWIDLFFISIGTMAVVKIVKTNAKMYVKIILLSSNLLVVLSVIYIILMHQHTFTLHIGGLGMILGHILNYKNHKH